MRVIVVMHRVNNQTNERTNEPTNKLTNNFKRTANPAHLTQIQTTLP